MAFSDVYKSALNKYLLLCSLSAYLEEQKGSIPTRLNMLTDELKFSSQAF